MRRWTVLCLALLLASCASAPPLTSGVVLERGYAPPYSWTSLIPIYTTTCAPPPGGCTMSVLMYVPMHHDEPARWWLRVQGDDGRRVEDVPVSEAEWARYQPGDTWP